MSLRSIIFKEETSRYILNMTAASFWRVLLLARSREPLRGH